jgi:transposase
VDRLGRTLGRDRAVAAAPTATAAPVPWPQAARRSQGVVRNLVRASHRDPVGVPAPGAGLRLWDDLLAQVAGLERRRCVPAAARGVARQTAGRRAVGHVAGGDRRLSRSGAQGRPKTGPSPVDRRKPGSKHHVITDAGGIPLAASLTGGNRHDVTQLLPLVDKVPRIKGIRGRPRQRPDRIYADRGYDFDKYRRELRTRGITPVIARRGVGHGPGLGTRRWVVEQTIALLHWFRRLRIRPGALRTRRLHPVLQQPPRQRPRRRTPRAGNLHASRHRCPANRAPIGISVSSSGSRRDWPTTRPPVCVLPTAHLRSVPRLGRHVTLANDA